MVKKLSPYNMEKENINTEIEMIEKEPNWILKLRIP